MTQTRSSVWVLHRLLRFDNRTCYMQLCVSEVCPALYCPPWLQKSGTRCLSLILWFGTPHGPVPCRSLPLWLSLNQSHEGVVVPCRNLPICSYLILDRVLGSPNDTFHVYRSYGSRKVHKDASSRLSSDSSFSSTTVFYSLFIGIRSSLLQHSFNLSISISSIV